MTKSISRLVPIVRQGIPFAAAAPTIREAHRPKKALPVRLPILSMLPKPQKQRSLQRHKFTRTYPRVCASQPCPSAQKIITLAMAGVHSDGSALPTHRPSSKIPNAFQHLRRAGPPTRPRPHASLKPPSISPTFDNTCPRSL